MPWPTETDYNEAVQTPRLAFDDLELRSGQAELTPLGLPRPYTGAFATVYKLQCGSRTWALRCFKRELADQKMRYSAISEALSRARLPYTVGFEFLERGIRVKGKWFPALKMEWVQGEGLAFYLQRHLQQSAALIALAAKWQRMAADPREARIAHGDLQHANVLIAGGEPSSSTTTACRCQRSPGGKRTSLVRKTINIRAGIERTSAHIPTTSPPGSSTFPCWR